MATYIVTSFTSWCTREHWPTCPTLQEPPSREDFEPGRLLVATKKPSSDRRSSRFLHQREERRQHARGFFFGLVNDPSAGSPTETLLRLLLPLNDQV